MLFVNNFFFAIKKDDPEEYYSHPWPGLEHKSLPGSGPEGYYLVVLFRAGSGLGLGLVVITTD